MLAQLLQGTEEWKAARCGSLGASRIAEAIARTKTGWGASRANLMAELVVERLTGVPTEGYVSKEMQWGTEYEPQARAAYEFHRDVTVIEVGLVKHPKIEGSHASPDGLVNDDGLLEIKCPNSATHIDTLLGATIPAKYVTQMLWQMACTGRQWVDFVSYDPRMPEPMRLFVSRLHRDDAAIAELEKMVREFLAETTLRVGHLRQRYMPNVVPLRAAG
jgi:putative phage-type endonuclease